MKNRPFAIAVVASVFIIAGALVIAHVGVAPALAEDHQDIRWCNTFVPYDKQTGAVFLETLKAPWKTLDVIDVSDKSVIDFAGSDVSIHKVKYGKPQQLKGLGSVAAALYFIDAATIKSYSPNAKIMYMRPISSLGHAEIEEIINSIQESGGQTKPYFATAMGSKTAQSVVADEQAAFGMGFVTTPIWWNSNTSIVLKAISATLKDNPELGKKELARFVAHSTKFGVGYNPDSADCEPRAIDMGIWMSGIAPQMDDWADMYIATSLPPADNAASVQKALFNTQGWPEID